MDIDDIKLREKMGGLQEFERMPLIDAISHFGLEKCCGNCCWFNCEMTDGDGFCAQAKDTAFEYGYTRCQEQCHVSQGGELCFVSRREMRHNMAVLLRMIRHKRRPDECKAPPYQHEVEALVFAYKYLEVFSKL